MNKFVELMTLTRYVKASDIDRDGATLNGSDTLVNFYYVGFTPEMLRFLKYSLVQNQLLGRRYTHYVFSADVAEANALLDREMPARHLSVFPAEIKVLPLTEQEIYEAIGSDSARYNLICVDTGDDDLTARLSYEISTVIQLIWEERKIFLGIVREGVDDFCRKIIEQADPNIALKIVGHSDFTADAKQLALARSINAILGSSPWESLSPTLRAQNFAAALHLNIKLDLLGLSLEENSDSALSEAEYRAIYDPENTIAAMPQSCDARSETYFSAKSRRIALAKLEHQRWCAFMFVNGWTPLELMDACERGIAKDENAKQHVCLVPFSQLVDVERAVNATFNPNARYVKADFEVMDRLPELISGQHLHIVSADADKSRI